MAGIGLLLLCARAGAAEPDVTYRLDLRFDLASGTYTGEGTLRVRNLGARPVGSVPLVLYPERFRAVDPAIDDVNFDRYYSPRFAPGGVESLEAWTESGEPLEVLAADLPGLPAGTSVAVALPRPTAPGAEVRVRIAFAVRAPSRLGCFGFRAARFVLDGGALPYVPGADATGRRDPRGPPATARFDLRVIAAGAVDRPPEILVDGLPWGELADDDERARLVGRSPCFAVGQELELLGRRPGAGAAPEVRVYGAPGGADRAERLIRIAEQVGAHFVRAFLPAGASAGAVRLVEAPLRDRLAEARDGVVLVSDRLFHVFVALQPFHRLEVERAVLVALARGALADLELGPDRGWVCEAIGWLALQEWRARRDDLEGSQVRSGLDALSFIPAFDRLVRAPRFMGSDLYYGLPFEPDDGVPDAFARALTRRARGRVVAEKLRDVLADEAALRQLVTETLGREPDARPPDAGRAARPTREDVRGRAAAAAGRDLGPFFELWLRHPPPRQNLFIADVRSLAAHPDGTEDVRVTVGRESDPSVGEVGEPVDVEGSGRDGPVRARWDGRGDRGDVLLRLDGGLFDTIELDPDRRVAQTHRGDDVTPRAPFKLLVNRLRARIDLNHGNRNEGAVGVTLHPLHRYEHAVVLDGYLEEDERGAAVSYAYRFGPVLDRRRYGLAFATTLTAAELTRGVLRGAAAGAETEGRLLSVGASLGADTRKWSLNPTWGLSTRIAVEYADRLLGTDFRFTVVSGGVGFVQTLWRGAQLGLSVSLGQSEGSDAPSQRLFDAGGEQTIRGVPASRHVGLSLFAIRSELRLMVLEELDVSLLWLAWLRKIQAVAFVDCGDVGDEVDDVVAAHPLWKWGAGGGLRLWIDAFGVVPWVIRFDVAVRVDHHADERTPQFYVGIGQSF